MTRRAPREESITQEEINSQRQGFANTLLTLLDKPLYGLITARTQDRLEYDTRLAGKAKDKFGSTAAISGVLAEVEKMLFWPRIDSVSKKLIEDEAKKIRDSIQEKGIVDQGDVKTTISLVSHLLGSLYSGKSVHEIRMMFRKVPEKKKSESEERETMMRAQKEQLYKSYFLWGYYPGIKERLHLTGDKIQDSAKIRKEEKRTAKTSLKGQGVEDALADIRQHIGEGRSTANERLFYLLQTNKLRGHWYSEFAPAIELLADFSGADISEDIVQAALSLANRVEKKRTFITPEQRRIAEAKGRDIREDYIEEDVSEEDTKEGNRYIQEVIARLYPDVASTDTQGNITIHREELEKKLGLPPLPERFIAFMKEHDPTYPG
ncbi:hypothetical protein HY621_01900 [Candidatus Uhrbacteria bacterium]|nr:hypothetical protein [Candidatus Uhrbacteria bacterium]